MKPATISEIVAMQQAQIEAMQQQIAALAVIVGGLHEDLPPTAKLVDYTARSSQRMASIAREFAVINGLRVDDIKGPHSTRPLVWMRQDLMALLHSNGHSTPEIGRFLHRDHTTVLHGIKASKARKALG